MKFIVFIGLAILVIATGIFGVNRFFSGNPSKLQETEEKVLQYLIEERNYKPSEISNIRSDYYWKGGPENSYLAYVKFKDDGYEYEYVYYDKQGVRPIGTTNGIDGKHNE